MPSSPTWLPGRPTDRIRGRFVPRPHRSRSWPGPAGPHAHGPGRGRSTGPVRTSVHRGPSCTLRAGARQSRRKASRVGGDRPKDPPPRSDRRPAPAATAKSSTAEHPSRCTRRSTQASLQGSRPGPRRHPARRGSRRTGPLAAGLPRAVPQRQPVRWAVPRQASIGSHAPAISSSHCDSQHVRHVETHTAPPRACDASFHPRPRPISRTSGPGLLCRTGATRPNPVAGRAVSWGQCRPIASRSENSRRISGTTARGGAERNA